jgi:predicted transcriptional regulator
MLPRKGPYEIIVEVLRIASGGSKKTRLRETVGMNYPQFVRYLEALHESGLLIEEYGLWWTTKKGLVFVVACEKCCSLLNDSNSQRLPPLSRFSKAIQNDEAPDVTTLQKPR